MVAKARLCIRMHELNHDAFACVHPVYMYILCLCVNVCSTIPFTSNPVWVFDHSFTCVMCFVIHFATLLTFLTLSVMCTYPTCRYVVATLHYPLSCAKTPFYPSHSCICWLPTIKITFTLTGHNQTIIISPFNLMCWFLLLCSWWLLWQVDHLLR